VWDKETFYVCVTDEILRTEVWFTVRAFSKEAAAAAVSDCGNVQNHQVINRRINIEAFTDKPEWMCDV